MSRMQNFGGAHGCDFGGESPGGGNTGGSGDCDAGGGNPPIADGGDCDTLLGLNINADVDSNLDLGLGDCSILNVDGVIALDLDVGADLGLA